MGCANGAAKRYAALRRGKPHTRFPLCPRFKLPVSVPVYARPGHPQLQARPFTSFPYSRHGKCGDIFRAGPEDALRAFYSCGFALATGTPGNLSCRLLVASPPGTTELRALCFRGPEEAGASKTKFCCSWTWRGEIGRPGSRRMRDREAAKVMAWRKSPVFQSLETGPGPASNRWRLALLRTGDGILQHLDDEALPGFRKLVDLLDQTLNRRHRPRLTPRRFRLGKQLFRRYAKYSGQTE